MQTVKTRGNLRIYAGTGAAKGLFIGHNVKTDKMSYWAQYKSDIKLSDCIY